MCLDSIIIGDNTWTGSGSNAVNNTSITNDCMIGERCVVVKVRNNCKSASRKLKQ